MGPVDGTEKSAKMSVSHALLLAGQMIGGAKALVRCRMVYESSTGVTMEMTIRSEDPEVCPIIAASIG